MDDNCQVVGKQEAVDVVWKIVWKIVDEYVEEQWCKNTTLRDSSVEDSSAALSIVDADFGCSKSQETVNPFDSASRHVGVNKLGEQSVPPDCVKGSTHIKEENYGFFGRLFLVTIVDDLLESSDLVYGRSFTAESSLVFGEDIVVFKPVIDSLLDESFYEFPNTTEQRYRGL